MTFVVPTPEADIIEIISNTDNLAQQKIPVDIYDIITNSILNSLIDDLLIDQKFNVMMGGERVRGINSGLPFIRSYIESLTENLKAS